MAQTTRRSYEITLRNTCSVALQQYCVGKWRDTQRNGTDHTFTQRHTSKLPLSFKTVVLMCRLLAATTLSKRRRGYEHKNSYISLLCGSYYILLPWKLLSGIRVMRRRAD